MSRCTHPITVGFKADGKTLAWSQKTRSKEYAPFQLACGKCIECRLAYAREWAVRCVHEATMYPSSAFITLTYSDESLSDTKLVYKDFQDFMKRLRRKNGDEKFNYIVCGEYGEKTKRPHWHAIVFNFWPKDAQFLRTNHRRDKIYESALLTETWGKGNAEFGSVSFKSAGYVARYSAKKLVHGDEAEEFRPIFKVSTGRAIGSTWLEKFHDDIFNYGRLYLPGEGHHPIPRYYQKWLKEKQPEKWLRYISKPKIEIEQRAQARAKKETEEHVAQFKSPDGRIRNPKSKNQIRAELAKIRLAQLQQQTKLK